MRELPNIKGLALADPYFDSPGRIDMLLGEDVLSEVFMMGGPKGSATAIETVFGWAIRGLYVPDKPGCPRPAAVHLSINEPVVEPAKDTTDALVRFWEVEEPGKPASPEVKTNISKHIHLFLLQGGTESPCPRRSKTLPWGRVGARQSSASTPMRDLSYRR